MNTHLVDRIVHAVLYEGYILYPYRRSIKNRQRWTFGGLYPEAYCKVQGGSDAAGNQTECLVEGGPATALHITVRFLHLMERLTEGQSWQEAEEHRIESDCLPISDILDRPWLHHFSFPGKRWLESKNGQTRERRQEMIEGSIEVRAAGLEGRLFKLSVRVSNLTPLANELVRDRDEALLRSLVSTHAILHVQRGAFVSLADPPEQWREAAGSCRNIGTWPVLVGDDGDRDTMLSSPIILYDYPKVAPESPGDLFDATEIDEILTLRILTLTDEEKRAAAALDPRCKELLARTESLAREQLMGLHGTFRGLRPVSGDKP
jgi:hydrogenase maturation protease